MQQIIQNSIDENRKKATNIDKSVWVTASAGSGKTTILVDRLLNLLINGVDIKKIVCVTYTNNAADEMRERIYDNLERMMIMDDDLLKIEMKKINGCENLGEENLNRIKTLFVNILDNADSLKIFTIHSFCQQLISKFPIEAGILPNFTIIDEQKKDILVKEVIETFLTDIDKYKNVNFSFERIMKLLSEEDFNNAVKSCIKNKKDINYIKNIDFKRLLLKHFMIDEFETKESILREYDESARKFFDFREFLEEIIPLIGNSDTGLPFISLLEKIKKNGKIEDYFEVFLTKEMTSRKEIRFPKLIKENKEFLSNFLAEIEKVDRLYQKLQNLECCENTVNMISLGFIIVDIYSALKFKRGFLDFDDLIILASDLLKNSEYSDWIRYKLDDKIEHILLDEAQDTSVLQWQIVDSLTEDFFVGCSANENPRSLFVVGDEKQSIFKFRGAAPELFDKKYFYYKNTIKDFEKVSLDYSFRSAKNILNFVDKFFESNDFCKKISKISTSIRHNVIRENVSGLVEVWPLVDVKKQEIEAWSFRFVLEEETEREKINAYNIARKIKSFFDNKKQLTFRNGRKDCIKYSDIMVLVRKRSGSFLFFLIKYLNKFKIPNSGFDRFDLFDDIFLKDLLCLMYFCKFPYDDLNTANIVKSPILNLTEDDLFKLCDFKNNNGGSLFDALKNMYPSEYVFLDQIAKKADELCIYDFCFYVLENLGIKKHIIERSGEKHVKIIDDFYSFIRKYESEENSDLIMFLNYVFNNTNLIKKDFNSTKLDQVRIITEHSAKGLQSPIVFICDSSDNINEKNSEDNNIFWYEGDEFNFPIFKKHNKSNILKDMVEKNKDLQEEEKYRLFYVAMTRAENELYICGIDRKRQNAKNNFYDIALNTLMNMNCEARTFDFDNSLKKYCIGNEENTDSLEDGVKNIEEDNGYTEFIEHIKNINVVNKKMEIFNPSQFFKHNDRDRVFEGVNINIVRGLAVHKLLEVLPTTPKEKHESISDIYLDNLFNNLTWQDKTTIKQQVKKILNNEEYAIFFGINSKAEVSVVGEVEGMNISGQIDRLVELEDKIIILDYKNTRKDYGDRESLPESYVKQLELYKKIVEKYYKNKTVESYILLTSFLKLIRVW
ncbi:MAG: UvrD-helicase domain-containing protein [Rickettsiales bacterium]|jgi:ATP-dependent helicase/nuclease subunit A|nr:UvrD-helicase domain-containing protein [Rickettsiales bacterium]